MALSSECEVHDWCWDSADDMGCPVCYGVSLAVEAIAGEIASVSTPMMVDREFLDGLERALDLVTDITGADYEGENKVSYYEQKGKELIQEIRDTIEKQHELFDELVAAIKEATK